MKKTILILFLASITVYSKDYTVTRVVSVYDGDTFRADLDCKEEIFCKNIPIRLNFIDTPEIRGKCKKEKELAVKARDYLRELLSNAKIIELRDPKRGKYFRIAGDVFVDNINVQHLMVKKHLAIRYNAGKKTKDWCE